MNKTFTLMALCLFTYCAKAQTSPPAMPTDAPYGKVDKEDLELKACEFEKDANAEVLIAKSDQYYDQRLNVVVDYHKRIKIFNDNGKDQANIRIEFISDNNYEYITGIQAETINEEDGKPVVTKLDKSQVFRQAIDKYRSVYVFTMPNVKPGSVIDYKYTWNCNDDQVLPPWFFQEKIPVRYSELETNIPEYYFFSIKSNIMDAYAVNQTTSGNGTIMVDNNSIPYNSQVQKRVMVNIPSLIDEPYMTSTNDNLRHISFVMTSFRPPLGFIQNGNDSWARVAGYLVDDEDFGAQLKRKLTGEEDIITKAQALKTDDQKIAFIFNQVKGAMKWNGEDRWYTIDGTSKAWDNKTGNSTEINLIMYHLLKKSGVVAYPMVVSTREHGKVNPVYPFINQFNRAVVYIPVDSTKHYFLDASDKYNAYNETPWELLNSSGLYINPDKKTYDLVSLEKSEPVRQAVFINAQIKPDGKLDGTADISSFSYNRIGDIRRYKKDGEQKYMEYLQDHDNNLKISSVKMENMEDDTLPLVQHINFNLDLAGSDDNYIYVNPNLFTSFHSNLFISDTRTTDIDFGCQNTLTLNAVYKLPAGYKVDALPKSVSMTTPDQGVLFKRVMGQQEDGSIAVRYVIMYKKSIYFKENYADFHEFFKKMFEMLNEQIVLKKS
jgi:hypothetical protein